MAKQVSFFDGSQSSTTPTIGNVDTTNLACYANDAAYEAANAGAPTEGNIYCNTTDNSIRYYNGTAWTELADSDTAQTFTNKTLDGTSATGTNTITIDADDASYDNTASGLTATNAQAAIDEVEGRLDTAETNITNNGNASAANTSDIADLRTTTGTADGDTDMGTFTGSTISDNVSTKTALQELETALEGLGSPLDFQGTWNASTNTPTLTSGSGTQGHFYIVDTAGSTNLDGITDWSVNDWAIFDGTVWRKVDNSEVVTSVNGQTGAVSLGANDLNDVNTAGVTSRRFLRRNIANTQWEDYNFYSVTGDSTSGSNVTLNDVKDNNITRLTAAGLVSVDMISHTNIYGGATSKLVNVTGSPIIINNETGATSNQQIITGTGGPITIKDGASVIVTYDNVTAKWRIVGGTGSGEGGTTGLITGDNSTADTTVGDWVTYLDAAQSTPVDGTGGVANITIARTDTASEILKGSGSFEITKGAFDRQGEGVSLDIAADKYVRGQAVKLSFSYAATADFDFGSAADPVGSPSDISVYLYDVTNSKLLTPSETGVFGGGHYESLVQIPSDCEDVRVILHIATANNLAWDFQFDRVQLDLAPAQTIKNASDWISYTPTTQGLGTIANIDFKYRIDGSDLVIQGKLDAGTPTAVEAQIGLPSGYISTNDLQSIQSLGYATRSTATSPNPVSVLIEPNQTYLVFGVSSSNGFTKQNGNILFNVGDSISFKVSIPVQGLTSGVSHPAAIGLNAKAVMRAYKSGGAVGTNTAIPSWTTVEKDSLGAFDATTGLYTVKSPGDYYVAVTTQQTANDSNAAAISVDRGSGMTRIQVGGNNATGVLKHAQTVIHDLKYGDQIQVQLTNAATIQSVNDGTTLSIFKIGSEQQPYAPRIAYLKDFKSAGTNGGGSSTSWATRDLNTIEGDSTFISLSTNQFTLQPGTYHIEAKAPCYRVGRNRTKLRDITNAADIIYGETLYLDPAGNVHGNNTLEGQFSISAATTFEIQHICESAIATNGFGVQSNTGTSLGIDELYSQVKITKVL